MEFKGTKGDWKLSKENPSTNQYGTLGLEIDFNESNEQCVTVYAASNDLSEEDFANARLITAAPDLLEALIEAQQQLAVLKSHLTNSKQIQGVSQTIHKSTFAINKALGL